MLGGGSARAAFVLFFCALGESCLFQDEPEKGVLRLWSLAHAKIIKSRAFY